MLVLAWLVATPVWAQPVDLDRPDTIRTLEDESVAAFVEAARSEADAYIGDAGAVIDVWYASGEGRTRCASRLTRMATERLSQTVRDPDFLRDMRRKGREVRRLDAELFGARSADGELWVGSTDAMATMHGQTHHIDPWVGVTRTHIYVVVRDEEGRERIVRVARETPDLRDAESVYVIPGDTTVVRARLGSGAIVLVKRVDGQLELSRVDLDDPTHEEYLGIRATGRIDLSEPVSPSLNAQTSGVEGTALWRIPSSGPPMLRDRTTCPFTARTLYAGPETGVRVPMTLVQAEDQPGDSVRPLWVKVYGGYGKPETVHIGRYEASWLANGGRIAVAHVRGGGARGAAWAEQGRGRFKYRTWDDLNRVVAHLHHVGLSEPQTTFVWGESHGALVAVSAAARRPELYGAVVAGVGVYDLISDDTMNPLRSPPGGTVTREVHHGYLWPEASYEERYEQVEPGGGAGLHPANPLAIREFPRPWGPDARPLLARELSPVWLEPEGELPPMFLFTGHRDIVVNPLHSVRLAAAWADQPGGPVLLGVYDTWTHGPPPWSCFTGWGWGQREMSDAAYAFALRATGLVAADVAIAVNEPAEPH